MRVIYGQRWYRPREIAQLKLIVNTVGGENEQSNYNYILNLIRTGRLRAKDYSAGTKMRLWLVPESEIKRYHDSVTKLD